MSWNLKGSYVETCSCELMCPCNLSFDHGATYDFCRVTLVFNIREGQIEGTDIGGLKVAAIADTPKVMTEGNWRLGVFVDERATDDQLDKLVKVFGGQLGGPMAGLAPLVGEMLGVERAAIEVIDDGVRHSVRVGDVIDFEIEDVVPFGVETGEPVRFAGMFHPVGVRPDDGGGKALADQRLRHPVRGKDRALDLRVLLGSLKRMIVSAPDRVSGAGLGPAFAAARARLGLVALLFAHRRRRLVVDRRSDARDGQRALDRPGNGGLVPRGVGGHDGRHDVPVGRPDGGPVFPDDRPALAGFTVGVRVRISRHMGRRRRASRSPSPRPVVRSPVTCCRGIAPAGGWQGRR